jgi:hypothetical protein
MPGYERNVAATIVVFAWDEATNKGKTGDAANLTMYYLKKGGTLTQLADTTFTELSNTLVPGYYEVDLGVSEIDAQYTHFFPKSATTGIGVIIAPPYFTVPVNSYLGTNPVVVGTNNDKSGYLISGTKQTLDSLNDAGTQQQIDDIEAEVNLIGRSVVQGTVQSATDASTFVGDSGLEPTDDNKYVNQFVIFTTGVLEAEAQPIQTYDASAFEFVTYFPFTATPEAGDEFYVGGRYITS